jgi:hypothetical protein
MADQTTVADWLQIIQAEYREIPGLQLTKPQVQRLWGLEPKLCDAVLNQLVASAFLRKTARDAFVLHGSLR